MTNEILPILYQDDAIVVVNKPSGLLVHRTQIDRFETRFAMQILRDQIGKSVYPVHRLDKPTSGALIFALSSEMARLVTDQFASRKVDKHYVAVVRGVPAENTLIDHPLVEEPSRHTDAQIAQTYVERLASVELNVAVDRYPTSRYSLVRAQPHTGRKHQIRRHLKHINHPIIGDVNHGKGKHNRFFAETFGVRRLLLACTEISFRHPRSGNQLVIRAPLCRQYMGVLEKLGWDSHVV